MSGRAVLQVQVAPVRGSTDTVTVTVSVRYPSGASAQRGWLVVPLAEWRAFGRPLLTPGVILGAVVIDDTTDTPASDATPTGD